jgi:hypothetical protein
MVLLVAADLLRGVRLERRLVIPVLVVVVAAVASNLLFLHESYESYERTSRLERADLTAVEIARNTVEPGLILSEDIADTGYVPVEVGSYLSARDAFGSPAYTEAELETAPEEARIPADKVLAAALGIELRPGAAPRGKALKDCQTVEALSGEATVVTLPAGGALLRSRGETGELSLGRFADTFPVQLGSLAPGAWNELAIPIDISPRPWRAQLSPSGGLMICKLSGGA